MDELAARTNESSVVKHSGEPLESLAEVDSDEDNMDDS